MRLIWFSPLPPMPSGIADYSAELLPHVARRVEVLVVCPRSGRLRPPPPGPPGIEVLTPERYERRRLAGDAPVYHLGNNPWHEFVYEAALARPGVAVFHDFVMHHLIEHRMFQRRRHNESGYRTLMKEEYGEDGLRAHDLRLRGAMTDFEKFVFPLNGHVARAAGQIVVHNRDSAERLGRIAPDVLVTVIPHHAGSPPAEVAGLDRRAARARLGLPADAFLVGHFGFITQPKQPAAIVGGFARLAAHSPDALLITVGADNTGGGLARLISDHGLQGRVRPVGFVDLDSFYLYLKAVDAVINLRYPSAGESSGTFARALAEGRVALVNNLGSFAEIPAGVALKVEVDGDQAAEIGGHLIRLYDEPAYRAGIEANARAYAATRLDPNRCADAYVEVAGRLAGVTG